MASLRDLYEHTPDPRIDKVRGYYDKASRMAEALYRGFLGSIPQPEGGPVYVDDQGNWSGGQLPEQQAYNTLSWLVPTGGVGEAVDFARNGLRPGTVKAITAYHGSPHKFDEFDMSKIGTGEGAQAYGHGLYFAEAPGIARDYQRKLATEADDGNLYKTSLEWPDPAREAADPLGPQHFLAWDRPLDEQPEHVLSALRKNPNYEQYWLPHLERGASARGVNPAGGDLFKYLLDDYYPDEVSELLKDQGIPGIRYLDGLSRAADKGTHNYVVFDDKIPKIVERNGVTLEDLLRR